MLGTIVLIFTVILFIVLLIRHPRHFFGQLRRESLGYCLLVEKYQEGDQCYLVFQQGDKEWTFTCSYKVYFQLKPLTRGKLFLSQGAFHSFEE